MDNAIWIVLPFIVAAGTALLSYVLLSSRTEVAIAREREAHARTQATLAAVEDSMEDKIRLAQEFAHRKALDQFMTGFRVEERRYLRDNSVVLHERLLFRNMPLSTWVEHELPVQNGALPQLDAASVFSTARLRPAERALQLTL